MTAKVTVIPGDGIGPEVTEATLRLLEAAGARIEWVEMPVTPAVDGHRNESDMHSIV